MTGRWPLPVASFWAGEPLSFVEQMTIRSYQEAGAQFTLYLAHPVAGVPDGVTTRPASDIMARPDWVGPDPGRKELAVWSDLFRVALLNQSEVIWVDLDAVCMRPFTAQDGFVVGRSPEDKVLSGVLAMPQHSAALALMTGVLAQDEVVLPWADPDWVQRRRKRGRLRPVDLPWGDTGPRLLHHALETAGGIEHVAAPAVHYPVFRQSLPLLLQPGVAEDRIVRPETQSVHVFGFIKRVLGTWCDGLPAAGSWLDRTARKFGVDPAAAPARGELLEGAAPMWLHLSAARGGASG